MNRKALLLSLIVATARADEVPTGFVASDGPTGLRTPEDVVFLADGGLAVSDPADGSVRAFGPDGKERWRAALPSPLGLARDGDGLWVAAGAELVRLDARGVRSGAVPVPADLHATDVEPGSDGKLWISAGPDDRVVLLGADGAAIHVVGGLEGPRGLCSDGAGGVWVAEALGGRLVHVDASGRIAGSAGGWGASEGRFLAPKDLARTADGGFVVADSRQGVLQLLDADGRFRRLVADERGAIQLVHPLGVDAADGRLAVADPASGKVEILTPGGTALAGGAFPADPWLFRPSTLRDPDPSTTCRQCHDGTRTSSFGVWDPTAVAHPTAPGPRAHVPESVPTGSGGTLRCTSCHAIHATEPAESDDVVRGSDPAPDDGGPVRVACGDCHSVSGHPLGVAPRHGAGGLPLAADGAVRCETCHPIHGARFPGLLARSGSDGTLCLSCHADHGPDRSAHPVGRAATAAARGAVEALGGVLGPGDTLTCLSCHDPHGDRDRHLLRARGVASACGGCHPDQARLGGHADQACAGCHGMHTAPSPTGPRACAECHQPVIRAPMHPLGGEVACTSCHDPHGGPPKACTSCHADQAGAVAGGPHDASREPVAGSRDPCTSCHEPHGEAAKYLVRTPGGRNPAAARCLRCHDGSTRATAIARWTHPTDVLTVGPPFTGPDGEPAPAGKLGQVTCATCHDAHSPATVRDVVGACAACHGSEAAERLRTYHQKAGEER